MEFPSTIALICSNSAKIQGSWVTLANLDLHDPGSYPDFRAPNKTKQSALSSHLLRKAGHQPLLQLSGHLAEHPASSPGLA